MAHRTYAKQVARSTASKLPMEMEDATSAAYVGLVQAAKSFDPSRYPTEEQAMVRFKYFARLRMHGAIIDEARRDSFVRRTDVERGERAQTVSFDEVWDGSGLPKVEVAATSGDLDGLIDFCDAMATLSERERFVINSIGAGMRQWEIAAELGVTESRVSQIATAARTKLKEKMA